MRLFSAAVSLLSVASLIQASPYREDLVDYNINTNQNAQSPTDRLLHDQAVFLLCFSPQLA